MLYPFALFAFALFPLEYDPEYALALFAFALFPLEYDPEYALPLLELESVVK